MINCSVNRGKYIIDGTPGDGIVKIVYTVYLNGETIYQGRCGYYGGVFEVDCADWMEQWIVKQNNLGVEPTYCKIEVRFQYYNDNDYNISTVTRTKTWLPESLVIDPVTQKGIICGGANGKPYYSGSGSDIDGIDTVSVWPIFFFRMTYKIGNKDYVDDNVMWDPNPTTLADLVYLEPGEKKYTYSVYGSTQQGSIRNELISEFDPYNFNEDYSAAFLGPVFLFHDPAGGINVIKMRNVYSSIGNMETILPIMNRTYTSQVEAGNMWDDMVFLRYDESDLEYNYSNNVVTYEEHLETVGSYTLPASGSTPARTMTNIDLELVGYGYKTMIQYLPGTKYYFTSDYVSCMGNNIDCLQANLVLFNSGFGNTTNPTYKNRTRYNTTIGGGVQNSEAPTDVVIPLMVENGKVKGKTINNLDKITYMDRYGDTHNSVMNNRYEVECYIDPSWLNVKTGDDLIYEKVMLAIQNSQRTFLCSTAAISGIECTGSFVLEGRIKDIEKIETYSRYNSSNRIPTYKITFEVYYR